MAPLLSPNEPWVVCTLFDNAPSLVRPSLAAIPQRPGVYIIFAGEDGPQKVLRVGKSDHNLQERVGSYRSPTNPVGPCIRRHGENYDRILVAALPVPLLRDRDSRERSLIFWHRPSCNTQLLKHDVWPASQPSAVERFMEALRRNGNNR